LGTSIFLRICDFLTWIPLSFVFCPVLVTFPCPVICALDFKLLSAFLTPLSLSLNGKTLPSHSECWLGRNVAFSFSRRFPGLPAAVFSLFGVIVSPALCWSTPAFCRCSSSGLRHAIFCRELGLWTFLAGMTNDHLTCGNSKLSCVPLCLVPLFGGSETFRGVKPSSL